MIEEGDPIWTLMVIYFMQKHTDNDGTTINNRGIIGDAHDLAQLDLLLTLRSKRDSVFDMEVTETSLHLNNTSLSEVVDIQDALVGNLNNRVDVFEEDRVVLKADLRQIQRETRYKAPGHAKVEENLEAKKDGEIDLGFDFQNPLSSTPINYSSAESFGAYLISSAVFLFFLTPPQR